MKARGFWTYGLAGEGEASLYDQNFSGNVAIVVGGEGEGIRPLVRRGCDVVVSIPLSGGVGSLNASVAGGIALFEVVRQRREQS
jgi:23S rRNA (guanosine2251-2'-O)-methyltransferase